MSELSIFDFHGYAKAQEIQPVSLPKRKPCAADLSTIVGRLVIAGAAVARLALQPEEGE